MTVRQNGKRLTIELWLSEIDQYVDLDAIIEASGNRIGEKLSLIFLDLGSIVELRFVTETKPVSKINVTELE
jgi:hypothetical protein